MNGFAQLRKVYEDRVAENEIYKLSFYSATSGYVAFRDWIGFTIDSGRTFDRKPITMSNVDFNGHNVNLTFGFGINGIKAFNRDTIIAYGDYGFVPAILYSVNGGNTFKLIFHSLYNSQQFNRGITDMVFPANNNIGYAIDADRILKTTNKGLTWTPVGIYPGSDFTNLEAPDNSNVFAFSSKYTTNKLLKSTNAGINWQTVTLPQLNSGKLAYVTFVNASRGWLNMYDYDNAAYIYLTINGGVSWTLQNDAKASPFRCSKMKFTNDSTGYALVDLFTVYKTTNSGRLWEPLPRNNNFLYLGYSHNDLQTLNTAQLWAGGGHGLLELSTNGGGTPLPKAYFDIDTTNVFASNKVQLVNFSKQGYQYQWYVNDAFVSSSYHASYTHQLASGVDSIKLIVSYSGVSDTLLKYQYFYVPPIPAITAFTPASGSAGTFVTIKGQNFTGTSNVSFGGTPAASFTIVSPTRITAVVGSGSTGNVALTNVYGTFSLPGFTYHAPPTSAPPVIASFSPLSGLIGTSVTITGSNFNPNPTNNIVSFGATKATVTSASTSQITCIVPAGASYVPVSVLNTTTHLSARSLKPFNVVFADSSNFTMSSFSDVFKFPLTVNSSPKYTQGHDMDGDGKPDVIGVVALLGSDSLCAFRNTTTAGTLSFAPRQNFALVSGLSTGVISLNDLDGDGKADVVCVTNKANVLAFLNQSNIGNIALSAPLELLASEGTNDVAIDDLDNDGRPDLAISTYNNNRLSVLRNTSTPGSLSFSTTVNYVSGGNGKAVEVGDLDGDGKKDVVCLNYLGTGSCSVSIFKNESSVGNISLASKVDISASGAALQGRTLELADFDGDGKLDIILLNDNNYAIIRNISTPGNITFAPIINNAVQMTHQGGSIANLNGDAKPDFIAGRWGGGNLNLYRNLSIPGSVKNDAPVSVANSSAYYTNSGDFDLDGKTDVIVSFTNDLSILKNKIGVSITFSVCENGSTSITADLTGTTYQWQLDSGSGFVNITDNSNLSGTKAAQLYFSKIPGSWKGYKFRCLISGNVTSTFVMQVKGFLAPTVTISTSSTSFCAGSPVTFTAISTNGGDNPVYQWQINGKNEVGSSSVFTTTTLKDKDQVRVILISSEYCSNFPSVISNVITMSANGSIPSVTINTSSTTICNGSTVTFTATPVNGGTTPLYQWKVNGLNVGLNNSVFSTNALKNGDSVTVLMTPTSSTCGTSQPAVSNVIKITVNTAVTPSISITTPTTTICNGNPVNFTATPVNGGNSPRYQWKQNGNNVGDNSPTFSTFSLSNGDRISVELTSTIPCATSAVVTSNVITMSTSSTTLTPTVSIITPSSSICAGAAITFTATPVNGGSTPSFQWQVNGMNVGTNSTVFTTSSLTDGSKVNVIMTSSATCLTKKTDTSNTITVNINPVVVPSVTITTTATQICEGTNAEFRTTATNSGQTPVFQWQVNGQNVGTNSPTYSNNSLKQSDQVKAILTSSETCASPKTASSNVLTINIIKPIANAGPDRSICVGGSGVQIGTTAISGYSYSWSPSTGLNSASIAQPVANPATTTTYILTASRGTGCIAKDTVIVTALPVPGTPTVTQAGKVFTSSAAIGNQWYKDGVAISGATEQKYTADSSGNYTTIVTLNGCSSAPSSVINYVVLRINPANLHNSIYVGPIPVQDDLHIRYNGTGEELTVALVDLTGKVLFAKESFTTSHTFNLTGLAAGTYMVQVVNKRTGDHAQRVIVKL